MYSGRSCAEVKALVAEDSAQKELFFSRRNKVIECCISNGGICTRMSMYHMEKVMHRETSALRHMQRGKALSVRKYKQTTGKNPSPDQIFQKRTRNGAVKEYVKVYNHSDSSEWSFEESDAEVCVKDKVVDDGSIIVDDSQMEGQFANLRTLCFAPSDKAVPSLSKRKARLNAAQLTHDAKEHSMTAEQKKLRAMGAVAQQGAQCEDATERSGLGASTKKEDDVSENVPSLARKLGRHQMAKKVETAAATGKVATKGAAKAKAKSKFKGAPTGKAGEQLRASLTESIGAAEALQARMLACKDLQTFKELESDIKDVCAKISGKEELIINLEMDDTLEKYRMLGMFFSAGKEACRSWKAFSHTGSEKNYMAFTESWKELVQVTRDQEGGDAPAMLVAGGGDLVRALMTSRMHKKNFVDAAAACAISAIMQATGVSASQAADIQNTHLITLFKAVVRRTYTDETWLVVWMDCIRAAGAAFTHKIIPLIADS